MKKSYVTTMNEILNDGFIPQGQPDHDGKMVTIKAHLTKIWKQISTHKFELMETKRTNVNI